MEVSLFEKVDPRPAADIPVGSFVYPRHTNLLRALTGDDGNALLIVFRHNAQTKQVELLNVADGQLRTYNPDRILHYVQVTMLRMKNTHEVTQVELKNLRAGDTFSIPERNQEENNHYMVSGAKSSVPNNIRVFQMERWSPEDLDADRHVIPTRWVCEVTAS